jgi:hypothetical protein
MNSRIVAVALAATALAVPAAAIAGPGKGHEKQAAEHVAKGKGKDVRTVTFVFKGTFTAPGTVDVVSGNAHVRKGGFVGRPVGFDLASAKIVAADVNADQLVDVADVADGARVVVKARVAKGTKLEAAEGETAAAIVARKLVVQTPEDDAPAPDPAP